MFDEVKINIQSGDGGRGIVAFRREKYVPKGGPSGGDGGNGGDVIFKVNPKMNTLMYFKRRRHFKADHGKAGGSSRKSGADASNLEIEVPRGTVIYDAETNAILADLTEEDESVVVLHGGRGGRGNAHFSSSSNQAPRMAEKGEPGKELWIRLELRLIADVGLVGIPNAGKSTLLSVISNAKPKIADYPFTTLEPNLGVVIVNHQDFVVADIPGLIEGAHMGVGLGHSFLRHVQRTRLLVHLLDGMSENPIADFNQINAELSLFDERLSDRQQIVVFTKMDIPEVQARWQSVQGALAERGVEAMAISAVTHDNVQALIHKMFETLETLPRVIPKEKPTMTVYELPEEEISFDIEKLEEGVYEVSGEQIERAALMTYWDYEEAIKRFQKTLEALGIYQALKDAGVEQGDTVIIGDNELEWHD